MRVRQRSSDQQQPGLKPTAMIDVVFLLLIFFVMTFRIIVPEGDFNMKMPVANPGGPGAPTPQLPPIIVRLTADDEGSLTEIQLNDLRLGTSFDALRSRLISIVGFQRGPGSVADLAEVQIDSDYGLRYEYTVAALSAVTGYRADDGSIIPLVEKVKLTGDRE